MHYQLVRRGSSQKLQTLPSPKPSLDVSVVLPTYNEERNVSRLVPALATALKQYSFEIIIVDDASTDATPALMDRYAKQGIVTALHRFGKRGIFSALRDGLRVARGRTLVIMDADFSHPPQMVPTLVALTAEYDLASGSRFMRGAGLFAPASRRYPSIIFNAAIRLILGPSLTDWTGGFHAMRRDSFAKLRFRYPAKWGEFDLELLHRARQANLAIREVPFVYNFREEGSSKSAEGLAYFLGYALTYGLRALRLRFFG